MNEVSQWLQSGAEVREGLRLLSIYAPNRHLEALVSRKPERFKDLLKKTLSRFADTTPAPTLKKPGSFRETWPFLSDPKCPAELKILAADKISAYHNFVSGHEQLYSCTDLESCFEAARKVIENYKQNRKIHSEFAYYKEHGVCLGKHEIFAESKRMAELRSLSIVALIRKRKNLEGSIWRIRNEIGKGTKPHLLGSREARLQSKQRELDEVNRMIEDFETRR